MSVGTSHIRAEYPRFEGNVVLVLPSSLDSNNGYHAQGLAAHLVMHGVSVVLAVPTAGFREPECAMVGCVSFDSIGHRPLPFRDGGLPSIVHAWTPREHVRK